MGALALTSKPKTAGFRDRNQFAYKLKKVNLLVIRSSTNRQINATRNDKDVIISFRENFWKKTPAKAIEFPMKYD